MAAVMAGEHTADGVEWWPGHLPPVARREDWRGKEKRREERKEKRKKKEKKYDMWAPIFSSHLHVDHIFFILLFTRISYQRNYHIYCHGILIARFLNI